jgi:mRNA interferase MazF
MPFEFGDVVLVPFPFTSQAASKKRPAAVVSNRAYNIARPDVVVMAITSQRRPSPAPGEIWVGEWQAAGLLKPSAVKPVFATLTRARHPQRRIEILHLPRPRPRRHRLHDRRLAVTHRRTEGITSAD